MRNELDAIVLLAPDKIRVTHSTGTYTILTEKQADEYIPNWRAYIAFGPEALIYDKIGQL